jgi:hypothetical protein
MMQLLGTWCLQETTDADSTGLFALVDQAVCIVLYPPAAPECDAALLHPPHSNSCQSQSHAKLQCWLPSQTSTIHSTCVTNTQSQLNPHAPCPHCVCYSTIRSCEADSCTEHSSGATSQPKSTDQQHQEDPILDESPRVQCIAPQRQHSTAAHRRHHHHLPLKDPGRPALTVVLLLIAMSLVPRGTLAQGTCKPYTLDPSVNIDCPTHLVFDPMVR